MMGWNRPLHYYFVTVQALDVDRRGEDDEDEVSSEGFLYSNLDDPSVPDVEHQLAYFQRPIRACWH